MKIRSLTDGISIPFPCSIIDMSSWKNLFTNTMLVRGKALYDDGSVISTASQSGDGITTFTASISDTSDVCLTSVTLDGNGELKDVSCSCQYHKKVTYCKHISALLYSVAENRGEKPQSGEKKAEKAKKYTPVPFNDDTKPHYLSFGDSLNHYMPTKETLRKAERLYDNRDVRNVDITECEDGGRHILYTAYVDDDAKVTRKVSIKLGRNGIRSITCTEPYSWYSYNHPEKRHELCRKTAENEDGVYELCVHKTAALLSLAEYIENNRDYLDYTDKKAESLIDAFRKEKMVPDVETSGRKYPVDIETTIFSDHESGGLRAELRLSVDGGKYYKVKDVVKLASAVRDKGTLTLSSLCTADFSRAELTARSEAVLKLVTIAENDYNRHNNNYYSRYSWKKSEIKISRFLDDFFTIMQDSTVLYIEKPVTAFRETDSSLSLSIEPVVDRNEVVAVEVSGRITGSYSGAGYIYWFEGGEFLRTDKRRLGSAASLIDVADAGGKFSFTVGRKYLDNFYQRVLPDLRRHGRVEDNARDMLE